MILGRGVATLVNGTVTVPVRGITSSATVQLTRADLLGTVGNLAFSITNGLSFTITSVSLLEQSTVHWLVTV